MLTANQGGDAFNVTYQATNATASPNAKVVVIRPGFSTHCVSRLSTYVYLADPRQMNFGQRYLELSTSFTSDQTTGQVTVHASQMPTNANIFQPGPALIFLVVDGIPSIGQFITVGSGAIETQQMLSASVLPQSSVIVDGQSNSTGASVTAAAGPTASANTGAVLKKGGAPAGLVVPPSLVLGALVATMCLLL